LRVVTLTLIAAAILVAALVLGSLASVPDMSPKGTIEAVAADATNDNGQHKLVRATDGALYLAYAAPLPGVAPPNNPKYAASQTGTAVFVARSDDDGATWNTETRLSRDGISAHLATLAAGEDGRIHAAWVDYETVGHVWYAVRSDGTWQQGAKISPGPFYAGFPAMVAARDAVHVLWYAAPPDEDTSHGSRYEIGHTRNEGAEWTTPVILSASSDDALNPTAALDRDGEVHAAWYQQSQGTYRAHYALWNGDGWSTPDAVSPASATATGVAMDVGPQGDVRLIWEQVAGDDRGVAFGTLKDGTWSEVTLISDPGAEDPVIATDDNDNAIAVWSLAGRIQARVFNGKWGPTVDLGIGTHPVILAGSPIRVAWTAGEGEQYHITMGELAVARTLRFDPSTAPVILAALIAVLIWGWISWRRQDGIGSGVSAMTSGFGSGK
jgi:hypothetical protein